MLLSVVIPVFDIPDTVVLRALESVVNCGINNIEILIIRDAGCKIDSDLSNLCSSYKTPIRYIKLSEKNIGLGGVRNLGMQEAKGEFIQFVDGDDYLEDDFYGKVFPFIKSKEFDIILFSIKRISKQGIESSIGNYFMTLNASDFTKMSFVEKLRSAHRSGSANNKIYRKKFLMDNKLLFEGDVLYEDFLFMIDLLHTKFRYTTVNAVYNYIERAGSITDKYRGLEYLKSMSEVYSRIKKKYPKENIDEYQLRHLTRYCDQIAFNFNVRYLYRCYKTITQHVMIKNIITYNFVCYILYINIRLVQKNFLPRIFYKKQKFLIIKWLWMRCSF